MGNEIRNQTETQKYYYADLAAFMIQFGEAKLDSRFWKENIFVYR